MVCSNPNRCCGAAIEQNAGKSELEASTGVWSDETENVRKHRAPVAPRVFASVPVEHCAEPQRFSVHVLRMNDVNPLLSVWKLELGGESEDVPGELKHAFEVNRALVLPLLENDVCVLRVTRLEVPALSARVSLVTSPLQANS